jgi:hypothetical protein
MRTAHSVCGLFTALKGMVNEMLTVNIHGQTSPCGRYPRAHAGTESRETIGKVLLIPTTSLAAHGGPDRGYR